MTLTNHPEIQKYLQSIRGLIQEMIAPHSDNPNAVQELENAVYKVLLNETRDLTPLPFGEVAVVDGAEKAVIFDNMATIGIPITDEETKSVIEISNEFQKTLGWPTLSDTPLS